MAITLSTWSFEAASRLLGVGVDAEKVQRFESLGKPGDPALPLVFSKKEALHNQNLECPAIGFCMCFCCKEAFFKALGEPYDFTECEVFPEPQKRHTFSPLEITIGKDLQAHHHIDRAVCFFDENGVDDEEMVAVVYLFGNR